MLPIAPLLLSVALPAQGEEVGRAELLGEIDEAGVPTLVLEGAPGLVFVLAISLYPGEARLPDGTRLQIALNQPAVNTRLRGTLPDPGRWVHRVEGIEGMVGTEPLFFQGVLYEQGRPERPWGVTRALVLEPGDPPRFTDLAGYLRRGRLRTAGVLGGAAVLALAVLIGRRRRPHDAGRILRAATATALAALAAVTVAGAGEALSSVRAIPRTLDEAEERTFGADRFPALAAARARLPGGARLLLAPGFEVPVASFEHLQYFFLPARVWGDPAAFLEALRGGPGWVLSPPGGGAPAAGLLEAEAWTLPGGVRLSRVEAR